MACTYMLEPKGHEKKGKPCGRPESKDGLCILHQPAPTTVAVTPVTYSWSPKREDGTTTVNQKFQDACDEVSEQIQKYCDNGPATGGQTFTGKTGAKNDTFQLLHQTQPRTNHTFFYNWQGAVMHVYAAGKHTGTTNTKYALTWFDGSSATIDLKKSTIV
ncbi:hypothetical protein [Rubrimonas cliftonensis]|uniref:Uncharacterized protein n=1 Tax=Rubrimonas cliftonensis TaxID=89524 RepID=A0A1H3YN76_9RHOB|nr:hypothetical protein [Rubrimonas cliftonensis]SEA12452.1 hypothetical protein SAMN05444370_103153 [Rubrimonas cliftonensis]